MEFRDKKAKGTFIGPSELEDEQAKLKKSQEEAESAKLKIEQVLNPNVSDESAEILNKLATKEEEKLNERIDIGSYSSPTKNDGEAAKSKRRTYLTSNLPVDRKERKLVSRIYKIIKQVLPEDIADNLIAKIQEELKITGKDSSS